MLTAYRILAYYDQKGALGIDMPLADRHRRMVLEFMSAEKTDFIDSSVHTLLTRQYNFEDIEKDYYPNETKWKGRLSFGLEHNEDFWHSDYIRGEIENE